MKIRLEHDEIVEAVRLYLNSRYVKEHVASVNVTAVTPKSYSDPTAYVIEADVTLAPSQPMGIAA